ncbi:hypothetical protein HWV62_21716 [Athelia sp. TMB]|nr:hypothetical protein HWV62_21716 [Athelia sp. TMB]
MGLHNINNEMIFKSNPQFIFHDSRGFESGSTDETDTVKKFLRRRADAKSLSDQLHAVWYCLPTDTDRPLLAADEFFFNECGIENVPVIAVFTKFDGLVTKSFSEIRERSQISGLKVSIKDAKAQAPAQAEIKLHSLFQRPLQSFRYPPAGFLYLKDMHRPNSTCAELIEETANAITDDALRILFLSVQQSNVDLCVRCALGYIRTHSLLSQIVEIGLSAFPHVWRVSLQLITSKRFAEIVYRMQSVFRCPMLTKSDHINYFTAADPKLLSILRYRTATSRGHRKYISSDSQDPTNKPPCQLTNTSMFQFHANAKAIAAGLEAKYSAFVRASVRAASHATHRTQGDPDAHALRFKLNALAALCLCMEQTFSQASAWGRALSPAFEAALDAYVASGHIRVIEDGIVRILAEREEGQRGRGYGTIRRVAALLKENRLRI